jgi:hypothetical protein
MDDPIEQLKKMGAAAEEASMGMRQLARVVRDCYVALCAEGFTEQQALTITSDILSRVMIAKQQGQ